MKRIKMETGKDHHCGSNIEILTNLFKIIGMNMVIFRLNSTGILRIRMI